MAIRRLMVVLDPTQDTQPAFDRALDSARIIGASLHLYICVNDEYGSGERDEVVGEFKDKLNLLADRARDKGISVICEVDWHDEWREQAVIAGKRSYADLIIKHSVDPGDQEKAKHIAADLNLLRQANCPVLMIKDNSSWADRRVLAAIFDRPADSHEALNDRVIELAGEFTKSYQSETHYVVAHKDSENAPAVDVLSARLNIPADRIHVRHGESDKVICETASEIGADIIIVGTIGRSGIRGSIVGNTSERILDQTECDVLVLK